MLSASSPSPSSGPDPSQPLNPVALSSSSLSTSDALALVDTLQSHSSSISSGDMMGLGVFGILVLLALVFPSVGMMLIQALLESLMHLVGSLFLSCRPLFLFLFSFILQWKKRSEQGQWPYTLLWIGTLIVGTILFLSLLTTLVPLFVDLGHVFLSMI